MTCETAVVKLGGSLVTIKEKPETVDYDSLEMVANQLEEYVKLVGGRLYSIVHGGGSFGHHTVAQILSVKGVLEPSDASEIQGSMLRLAMEVARMLASKGLSPSLHPPHSFCVEPGHCSFQALARDVKSGLVPLTFGDAIPTGSGVEIVSGDDLAVAIALGLRARCLVFATRVPGVLDTRGGLKPVVRSLDDFHDLGGRDATGGMRRKVEAALRASIAGVEHVYIVGGERLLDALKGMNVGTRVEAG